MAIMPRAAGTVAILAALAMAAPAHSQTDCPRGTTPTYNTATQRIACIGHDDICPPGETPRYNTATETVICVGDGDRSETERPEPLCPPGRAALRIATGEMRCVDLTVPPIADCAGPYHESRVHECVWTCAAGTQPDEASGECICQPGLVETGTDDQGRRVCSVDTTATIPVPESLPELIPIPEEGPLPPGPGPGPIPDATTR